eukprot:m.6012 g.6012  ORF g.6012 m.6012 type:complete len:146 (+) comp2528_c0_seq1:222-659(+)
MEAIGTVGGRSLMTLKMVKIVGVVGGRRVLVPSALDSVSMTGDSWLMCSSHLKRGVVGRPTESRFGFHTSSLLHAGQKHRLSQGDSRSGTEYGVLTDGPDWSYLDGDQSFQPMTKAQAKRQREMQKKEERVAELLKQINNSTAAD